MKDLTTIVWENIKRSVEHKAKETAILLKYSADKESVKKDFEQYLSERAEELNEKLCGFDDAVLQDFYAEQRKKVHGQN